MPHLPSKGYDSTPIVVISVAGSAISFVGSMFVVLSYFLFPQLRKFAFELVVMLAIADLGTGIAYFLGDPDTGTARCTCQGLLLQYFQNCSFLWTTCIAFVLNCAMKMKMHVLEGRHYLLHLYAWGLPTVFTLIPLSTAHKMPERAAYGSNGAWCWINANTDTAPLDVGTVWRFVTFYVPLWMCMLYNLLVYRIVTRIVQATMTGQGEAVARTKLRLLHRLRLYPLILVACWLPATVNRIQNAVAPGQPIFWLVIIARGGTVLQGLCNSTAYGLNAVVQAAWVDWCGWKVGPRSARPEVSGMGWCIPCCRVLRLRSDSSAGVQSRYANVSFDGSLNARSPTGSGSLTERMNSDNSGIHNTRTDTPTEANGSTAVVESFDYCCTDSHKAPGKPGPPILRTIVTKQTSRHLSQASAVSSAV